MPEFLSLYVNDIKSKLNRIKEYYYISKSSRLYLELEKTFRRFWIGFELMNSHPSEFSVLAIDSSSRHVFMGNGGIFYVVRGLGITKREKYRDLIADFDFVSDHHNAELVIRRKMEFLEHRVAIKAVEDGFKGFILIDGSIYGRLVHIPIETCFANDREFMLEYFKVILRLLELCEREGIPLVGISKESVTSFFREFLIREIAVGVKDDLGLSAEEVERLLSLALDDRRKAIEEVKRLERSRDIGILKDLIEELLIRAPDFHLILNYADFPGYTVPLILGSSIRLRRSLGMITRDPESFVRSHFPISSRDDGFVDRAVEIVKRLPELPAVVSFHILPAVNDTPMRVDIPAWVFGLDYKLYEIGWPEKVEVDIDAILKLISAGYCGLDNYNVWLKAVDDEVKLSREVFENLYLSKFEELVGKSATSRGYRRVRYP